jgi:hypothetical protein
MFGIVFLVDFDFGDISGQLGVVATSAQFVRAQ